MEFSIIFFLMKASLKDQNDRFFISCISKNLPKLFIMTMFEEKCHIKVNTIIGVVVVALNTTSYIYTGAPALFVVVMCALARMDSRTLLVRLGKRNCLLEIICGAGVLSCVCWPGPGAGGRQDAGGWFC